MINTRVAKSRSDALRWPSFLPFSARLIKLPCPVHIFLLPFHFDLSALAGDCRSLSRYGHFDTHFQPDSAGITHMLLFSIHSPTIYLRLMAVEIDAMLYVVSKIVSSFGM